MVAHEEESMLCIVGAIAQRLESEIEAVAAGTTITSARNTQAAVDRLHT